MHRTFDPLAKQRRENLRPARRPSGTLIRLSHRCDEYCYQIQTLGKPTRTSLFLACLTLFTDVDRSRNPSACI